MKNFFLLSSLIVLCLTGCQTMNVGKHYDPVGYAPNNPSDVKVKVSLNNRMVYVMEGDRPLLVAATAIGKPGNQTPKGNFRVFQKIENKRSGSYGFWVKGASIIPAKSSQRPGAGYRYVGFPMQYWVEFLPGYGFHVGSVWPTPRTHGCLRLHENAAREFFQLTRIGTPVSIQNTQPEDATLGKNPARPQDYNDPDPASSFMISSGVFKVDPNDNLRKQP